MVKNADVLIIGGGPAGASAALSLRYSKLKIILVDKDIFPRYKICGDGISTDTTNQLDFLSDTIKQNFEKITEKNDIEGISIFAPNAKRLNITVNKREKAGFVVRRYIFDNLLMNEVKKQQNIEVFENTKIIDFENGKDYIFAKSSKIIFGAKIIIGADGINSITVNKLSKKKNDPKHFSLASQAYYKNVETLSENFIELHLLDEILPGYFWIFPAYNNIVNVGLITGVDKIKSDKINLIKMTHEIILKYFSHRFLYAEQISEFKVRGLPQNLQQTKISGEKFILTGDAASLIDPLTGEGIANAIRSGRYAAEHIFSCFKNNNFSAVFNEKYEYRIKKALRKEIFRNEFIKKIIRRRSMTNFLVNLHKNINILAEIYGNSIKFS